MKSNKAILSRIRKTKKGKLLSAGEGRGHFNAKHARLKKMKQKRQRQVMVSAKMKQRFQLS